MLSIKRAVWKTVVLTVAALALGLIITLLIRAGERVGVGVRNLTGVVLMDDPNIERQHPIANVKVEASGGSTALTDAAGLFRITVPITFNVGGTVTLSFRHPDYTPKYQTLANNGELYVIRMKPASAEQAATTPEIPISDVRVRYTENSKTSVDTGSALKSFEVVNTGNVPCDRRPPCSPDGKWKAAIGGATLDAGEGNSFREARVSCISGPCPFTRIETDGFSRGGRTISVRVRNWSDSAGFVMEAEVTHTGTSDLTRLSYPFIFGRAMNFSLPPSGEGPSIVAAISGMEIVYPLGPDLTTSFASCSVQVAADSTKSYRCDLKPGYRFQ